MSILKNPLKSNYSKIPNALICDSNISAGAFRVAAYLFSKIDGWEINNNEVKKTLGIGQNATIAGYWKELLIAGWVTRERIRDENGSMTGGYDYALMLEPTLGKTHIVENPTLGKTQRTINKTELVSKTEMNNPQTPKGGIEIPALQIPGSTSMRPDQPPASPVGFDELWELYGHKRSKPDAIKAYSKIPAKDLPNLPPGVKSYLAYLALPENSWRQQKLLAAFIRARMWEDDWGQPKKAEADQTPNEIFMVEMLASYPNLKKLVWLSDEEYILVTSRSKSFLGDNWEFHMSPSQLERAIEDSWREMNQNRFKLNNHAFVYNFLKEEVKSRIYPR